MAQPVPASEVSFFTFLVVAWVVLWLVATIVGGAVKESFRNLYRGRVRDFFRRRPRP